MVHRRKTANKKCKRLTGKQEDRQSVRFSKQSNIQKEQAVVVPMVQEVGRHDTMYVLLNTIHSAKISASAGKTPRKQEGRT